MVKLSPKSSSKSSSKPGTKSLSELPDNPSSITSQRNKLSKIPIFCTDAPNDRDLVAALSPLSIPVPIKQGDAIFQGVNDEGKTIRVLVERKKIGDMANSVLGGRYLSQLQAAHEAKFDTIILIVEGRMRPSPKDGSIEIPGWVTSARRGRGGYSWRQLIPVIQYSRFEQYLTELAMFTGVIVKRSEDVKETAAMIKSIRSLVQIPPSAHTSLHSMYLHTDQKVLLTRPSFVRRVARELDGVGWDRSGTVASHFKSVTDMCHATVKEWCKIEGIGKTLAEAALRQLNGGVLPNQSKTATLTATLEERKSAGKVPRTTK